MDKTTIKKRLLSRIKLTPGGCWEWQGATSSRGYGQIRINGKTLMAHRVSFEVFNGNLGRKRACHRCDNPPCINPKHLFAGSQLDNIHDAISKGRLDNRGERHGMAKLTEAEVVEIRRLVASGMKQKDVAPLFDVRPSYISRIVNNQIWKVCIQSE
jgi:hypothetical protein